MRKNFSALLACILAAAGFVSAAEEPPAPQKPPPAKKASRAAETPPQPKLPRPISAISPAADAVYLLQQGDDLAVSVWGEEKLNREVRIGEGGSFTFPPIGSVQAAGRPLKEVEGEIQSRLNTHFATKAVSPAPEEVPSPSENSVTASEIEGQVYLLQCGDGLTISVWGHEDLSEKVQIRDDGTFSFPLIGDVLAVEKTAKDVEREVQERLGKDYIVNPQVTVLLSEAKFSVLGDVKSPGSYALAGPVDILTAVNQAGGPSDVRLMRAELLRQYRGKKIIARIRPERILKGEYPNIGILPRDTVYVKEILAPDSRDRLVVLRLLGAKFSILGDVERPGSYEIDGPIDLLTAVSMAGGTTKFASNQLEIIRGAGKEKRSSRVNLDRVLRGKDPNVTIYPRDTIYVRRRLF